jgi:hypothetical protein
MPKRGQRGQQAKQTEQYRKMYANAPQLCKSQVYNALYDKLKKDGRLDRFIAVVQYCSMSGLDIKDSVQVLVKSFPSYIDEKDLTVDCLNDMIKNYSDISVAWGYGSLGDEISQIIVKNKALKIVENTDNMEDIRAYQEMFGKKDEISSTDNKTTVNFNLFKKG